MTILASVASTPVVDALVKGLEGTQAEVMSGVSAILPVGLGIFAAFVVVKLGIKFFKIVTG